MQACDITESLTLNDDNIFYNRHETQFLTSCVFLLSITSRILFPTNSHISIRIYDCKCIFHTHILEQNICSYLYMQYPFVEYSTKFSWVKLRKSRSFLNQLFTACHRVIKPEWYNIASPIKSTSRFFYVFQILKNSRAIHCENIFIDVFVLGDTT